MGRDSSKEETAKHSQSPDSLEKTARKKYTRPELIEYGSVEKLTQFGSSAGGDFFGQQN